MKIVYIIKSLAAPYGTERILIDKMNYLADKLSYKIYIITYEQGNHSVIFPLSSKITHIDLNTRFFTLKKHNIVKKLLLYIILRIQFKCKLKQNIKKIDPNFVIFTNYSFHLTDTIVNLNEKYQKIFESHVSKESIGLRFNSQNTKIKYLIATFYDNYILKKIKKCSALVTLTNADSNSWKSYKNSITIPNFVTMYPNNPNITKNKKQIISVGRLEKQKGYDILINIWRIVHLKHPEWILKIYGSGSEKTILEHMINNLGLSDTCIINDPVPDIYNKYQESSIYVMSSRYEGFGLVLTEAMSCALPCISFKCPHGPEEIISNEIDGFLIEPYNTNLFAEKICYLIENEDLRLTMGLNARNNVKRYLSDNIMSQWVKLFNALSN